MQVFDVFTTVRIRVQAADVNRAESHALTMLESHLGDILDNHLVIETGIELNPRNPASTAVNQEVG